MAEDLEINQLWSVFVIIDREREPERERERERESTEEWRGGRV